jgi:hypothetical protein
MGFAKRIAKLNHQFFCCGIEQETARSWRNAKPFPIDPVKRRVNGRHKYREIAVALMTRMEFVVVPESVDRAR